MSSSPRLLRIRSVLLSHRVSAYCHAFAAAAEALAGFAVALRSRRRQFPCIHDYLIAVDAH